MAIYTALALVALAGFVLGDTCYCPMNYDPVCASNGERFPNLCMLKCHNLNNHDDLQVAPDDRCVPKTSSFQEIPPPLRVAPLKLNCYRRCPHTPLPVCGSDGTTYGSACAFYCAKKLHETESGVTIAYHGKCKSSGA